jgi:hypothetical protein
MVKNKYKAPAKIWKGFKTESARQMYNDVMEQALKNFSITRHPETAMSQVEWETICHNMATYAAWALSKKQYLTKGSIVVDIRSGKETQRQIAK